MRILKERFGLLVLIVLLAVITVTAIKPGLYLLGWDNYSSYFNLRTNLFRTFFATWREYRGIGVASDSEVVDIFRQLFFWVFSFVVPEQLLDQLYVLAMLWAGVLGIYVVVFSILPGKRKDVGAGIAAGFYLFNLNTLATFYFPIMPYVMRFGTLPWVLWALVELVRRPVWTTRFCILCVTIVLFSTGSYLTATVFLTTVVMLVMVLLFQGFWKRVFLVLAIFLALNSFWILPFTNYTREKSQSIRLAPVFVETNELQLNQRSDTYSWKSTLLLMPNFFATTFTDIQTRSQQRFHELATLVTRPDYQFVLAIFPALALVGVFLIVITSVREKKIRPLLWAPCVFLLYVIVSMKEYSPLGRVYELLTAIPYFSILFRFGDTKFHPYLVFAGSISAGAAVAWMTGWVKRWMFGPILLVIAIPTFFVFRSYFQGNLVGFFMYNRLPDAYRQIASVVNEDPSYGRVLHLPFDPHAYWKSYSWGPIGSSFLHFLLDKPFLDKTFEPASLEQSSLFEELATILEDAATISEKELLDVRADALYRWLSDTSVRYVIVDRTVTPEVVSRGLRYWGMFNLFDSISLTTRLKERGMLELVGSYPVDKALADRQQTVDLYRLRQETPVVSFPDAVTTVDNRLGRQGRAVGSVAELPGMYVEDRGSSVVFPFLRRDAAVEDRGSAISLALPIDASSNSPYRLVSPASENGTAVVEVTVSREEGQQAFRFYQVDTPTVAGQIARRLVGEMVVPVGKEDGISTVADAYRSNWHILGNDAIGASRLAIGDVVLPVPAAINAGEKSLGTVLVRVPRVPVSLLTRSGRRPLSLDAFSLTAEPNCFGDQLPGYSSESSQTDGLTVRSVNGSTCMTAPIGAASRHKEIGLEINGEARDLDPEAPGFIGGVARAFPKPNTLLLCIRAGSPGSCINTHQAIRVPADRSLVVVPMERVVGEASSLSLLLALKNVGYQHQSLTISQAFVDEFRIVKEDALILAPPAVNADIDRKNTSSIQIDIPKVLSPFSYYYNPRWDAFLVSNRPCESVPSGYRTTRVTTSGMWFSIVGNCSNDILQTIPFSGNTLYLWDVSYRLFSGEFPKFILRDSFAHYRDEYLSLYQGYPDISGFGLLQHADSPGLSRSVQEIAGIITGSPATTHATTYIYPKPELGDGRDKAFTLTQHAGNHGIWALDDFTVMALPEHWAGLSLTPREDSRKSYTAPFAYTVKSLLPSLWHVEVTSAAVSGPSLLEFRQGFDRQWGVFDSLRGILVGKSLAPSVRCQGYANCFTLSGSEKKRDLYLFYTPERLSLLGWLGTAATVAAILIVLRSRRSRSS